jgi:transcriptional regulator of acetoin/glycerol metabolism
MELLLNYPYPGNVRELENILEHALIICQEDKILPAHLPEYLQVRPPAGPTMPTAAARDRVSSDNKERDKLLATLQRHNWHRNKSARALGMDRTTLWRKMKKYGLLD